MTSLRPLIWLELKLTNYEILMEFFVPIVFFGYGESFSEVALLDLNLMPVYSIVEHRPLTVQSSLSLATSSICIPELSSFDWCIVQYSVKTNPKFLNLSPPKRQYLFRWPHLFFAIWHYFKFLISLLSNSPKTRHAHSWTMELRTNYKITCRNQINGRKIMM